MRRIISMFLVISMSLLLASFNVIAKDEEEVIFAESFEAGKGEWKFGSPCNIVEENATDGKASIYYEDSSDSQSPSIYSPKIPVTPMTIYTASAAFKEIKGTVSIWIRFYDEAGKNVGSKSASAAVGKVTLTAPDTAVTVQIFFTGNNASTGSAYIDDVKLIAAGEMAKEEQKAIQAMADISKKLKEAKPGDIITIPDGTYKDVKLDIGVSGEEGKPITLKAENPGKVKLMGESSLKLNGSYIVVSDLAFENCTTTPAIISFNLNSRYCEVKNTSIVNCDPTDLKTAQRWFYVYGKYHRISNCYMRGKTAPGMMVEVVRKDDLGEYHIIENSYFGDFKQSSSNGLETIRIGISGTSLTNSYTTVKGCFFEACNAEAETISVKSGANYILNNTLYNNMGAIVLRHGNGTLVEGNLVIGGEPTSALTGVRIIGQNHVVKNNYFYNLPLNSTAIYPMDGAPDPEIDGYHQVVNLEISNNTVFGADHGLLAGNYTPDSRPAFNRILPPEGKIVDNAFLSFKGNRPLIQNGDANHKFEFIGNIASGKALGYEGDLPSGIEYGAFSFTADGDYLVPENGKGANIEEIKKAPKSPFDVMPKWVKEIYYDTGLIKFEPVEGDPFNTDFDISSLIYEKGKINVFINGYRKTFDVDPQLINSRTMVPMRAIFEEFGADVSWNEATATATAKTNEAEVKIIENSDIAYVDGGEVKLDSPAIIINGRFLVPLRFVSEAFGAKVGWIDPIETVLIDYDKKPQNYNNEEFKKEHNIVEKGIPVVGTTLGGFTEEGNELENVFDSNLSTKWTSKADESGNNASCIFDFGKTKTLDKLYMAYSLHNTRVYSFELFVSDNNVDFVPLLQKTGTTKKDGSFEAYDLKGASARYVKIVLWGNNENNWNNISEIIFTSK